MNWTANLISQSIKWKSRPVCVWVCALSTADSRQPNLCLWLKNVYYLNLKSEQGTLFGVKKRQNVLSIFLVICCFLSFFSSSRFISLRKSHKLCLSIKTSREEKRVDRKCHVILCVACCFGIFVVIFHLELDAIDWDWSFDEKITCRIDW